MSVSAPMRCSSLAEALDEPMIGSVDQRTRWLLVEDRSPWGERAVRDVLGADVEAAARERGVRLLLVRRREGDPAADVARRAFLVDTVTARAAERVITDLDEVPPLLDAEPDGFGAPVTDAMLLVCTNGRRDACCALRGRALVASLAVEHAARTWECTHLGGHRFAGNMVCLPHGIVYGRVSPTDGPRIADAYLAGQLEPDMLRGRSAWPPPAQVAEQVVRRRTGLDGLDDLRLVTAELGDETAVVVLATPDGDQHRVQLRAGRGEPRPISCRADEPEAPLHWSVVAG